MKRIEQTKEILGRQLIEDDVWDDVTSRSLGIAKRPIRAELRSRQSGVYCGASIGQAMTELFPETRVIHECEDGTSFEPAQLLVSIRTDESTCLAFERSLINLVSHLCGVATFTRQFVDETSGTATQILATRKTLPGLRNLQLYAVECGGGRVHRRRLSDGILIKDNHLNLVGIEQALRSAHKNRSPLHRVEIEVDHLEQLNSALEHAPDLILLDNFTVDQIREALTRIHSRCAVEVSGNVQIHQVKEIASLGVDYISVGRLTHSVPNIDLSLEVTPWNDP